MHHKKIKYLATAMLLLIYTSLQAQTVKDSSISIHKKVRNVVPRIGIGMSRHFITEVGIAYMNSNFVKHRNFGINTNNFIYYLSFETMTPYKKPMVKAYKAGVEMVNVGHVTSAGGLEIGLYQKDTLSSFVMTYRMGLPIVDGLIAYGFSSYFNPAMRKEVGRHRISISYCFNRKSDKALHAMLSEQKNKIE